MQQIEVKKVFGLELQSNSFNVREGSLELGRNVVLIQDNIYSKRRGSKLFYEPIRTVKNLTEYKDKLIGFCLDKVQVYNQNSDGSFASVTELSGETINISSKARNVQSNGNLYFTTANGVLKLENTANGVLTAGVKRALDLTLVNQDASSSETYMTPDSNVGYRILFGRRDANNNTVIGAPSELLIVTNSGQGITGTPSYGAGKVTFTATSSHGLTAGVDYIYIKNADGDTLPDGVYLTQAGTTGSTIVVNSVGTGTSPPTSLVWGKFYNNRLEYSIPQGLSTEYFVQIYRSNATVSEDVSVDESTLQLIDEFNLESGEITAGFATYVDEIPDLLRGAFLYTNPNTGEPGGLASANDEPPLAQDVALFKGHVFYANVQQKYGLSLSLISSNTTTMPDNSELTVTGSSTRTYIGKSGAAVGNRTVKATGTSVLALAVTVTYANHGFSNGDTVTVIEALDSSGVQIANLPVGNYTVSSSATNTFVITAPVSSPSTLSTLYFAGLSTSAGKRLFYIDNTSSTSVSIDTTARALCKAINRDSSGSADALYVSAADDIPGKMFLRSRTFTQTFYLNNVTSAIGESFSPILSTSGQSVVGTRTNGSGRIFVSKLNEPEAVPLANTFVIGSESQQIFRLATLRDSLILLKEDGVYRINGDDVSNFVSTILDGTVVCKASDSMAILDNSVYCYTEQGIASINETSASIVSRQIEPLLTSTLSTSTFSDQTHAVSYESERLYLCTTIRPNSTIADELYCNNYLTEGWTTWDSLFYDAYVKPTDNKLYYISLDNIIYQERKNGNRLDYCGEDFSATILTVPSTTTVTMSVVGGTPDIGDIFVKTGSTVINRIISVSGGLITFARPHGLSVSDTGSLYQGITSEIITSPLVGGAVSLWKQFSEFQIHYRNIQAISRLTISFITDSTSGSSETLWTNRSGQGGWGELPWGDFQWGLEEGINLTFDTQPAQPIRTYVPLTASRGTFIKAHITHNAAAENMLIQALAYTARTYGQRVTR